MMTSTGRLAAWTALLAFTVTSCSSAINVRPEDYGRIASDNTYRIVTLDNREYEATNLAIKNDIAEFRHDGKPMSVPLSEIRLIQHINNNEILTGAVALGIAAVLTVGLVLVLKPD